MHFAVLYSAPTGVSRYLVTYTVGHIGLVNIIGTKIWVTIAKSKCSEKVAVNALEVILSTIFFFIWSPPTNPGTAKNDKAFT